jgi:hypothetical protein
MRPENVLMGIRRGLGLALVLSISFCPCELSHDVLDFWAPAHGSGQASTSNLWWARDQLRGQANLKGRLIVLRYRGGSHAEEEKSGERR